MYIHSNKSSFKIRERGNSLLARKVSQVSESFQLPGVSHASCKSGLVKERGLINQEVGESLPGWSMDKTLCGEYVHRDCSVFSLVWKMTRCPDGKSYLITHDNLTGSSGGFDINDRRLQIKNRHAWSSLRILHLVGELSLIQSTSLSI